MSFLELIAAIMIAFYAMVGGAFLNASITAPDNTRRLLVRMWQSVFEMTAFGVLLLATSLVTGFVFRDDYASFIANPFIWSGAAQIAVVGIFWVCRAIVEILVEPEQGAE